MKKTQKRTCKGCKALQNNVCLLGFDVQVNTGKWKWLKIVKPNEGCPKPKNYDDLYDCRQLYVEEK